LSFAVMMAFSGSVLASPVPVQVTFNGAHGTAVFDPYGNVVTPYEVVINDGSGPVVQIVTCYDNQDGISPNDPPPPLNYWELGIDDVLTDGMFQSFPDALEGYQSIAFLSAQTYSTHAQQVGLQYAIWDVFGTVQSLASDPAADAAYHYYQGLLTGHIGALGDHFASFDFSHTIFLEPTTGAVGASGTTQPFVFAVTPGGGNQTSTPEPGTIVMIGSGLLCLLSSMGFKRFAAKRS
jgi:hypothetical protein